MDTLLTATKMLNEYTLAFIAVVEGVAIVYLHKLLTKERAEHMETAKQVLPIVVQLARLLDRRSTPRTKRVAPAASETGT